MRAMENRRENRKAAGAWGDGEMDPSGPRLVKRSLAIAGHKTSLALEPEFWAALEAAAREANMPLARLVAEIDASRAGGAPGRSLASAVRVWLLTRANAN